jgi:transcription-repair coupling factor (superfamily II helicase)
MPTLNSTDPPGGFVLAVTATAREAEDLTAALGSFLPPRQRGLLPRLGDAAARAAVAASDTVGQRIAVLRRLAHPADPTRAERAAHRGGRAGPGACCSRSWPGSATWSRSACTGRQEADLDDVLVRLVEIGYARTDLVTKPRRPRGPRRHLDVFPPTEEHPLRVEFFGDTVEEIRSSRSPTSAASAWPKTGSGRRPAASCCSPPRCGPGPRSSPSIPGLADILGKLAEGITVEGMEAFAPVLAERMDLLLDYVPRAASCSPATPSGSAPGPRNSSGPARSSSRRRG